MAGTCEACRAIISITQKRIKCTLCSQLYHSECINFSNESDSRSQWKCPTCVAKQRKGGDNTNTPVRGTAKTKETKDVKSSPLLTILSTDHQTQSAAPSAATRQPSPSLILTPSSDCDVVSQIENILDIKLNLLKTEMINKMKESLTAELRRELQVITTKYEQLENAHLKLISEHESLKYDFDLLKKTSVEDGDKLQDLQAQYNKQQQWARMANIEIVGLPELPNESIVDMVVQIANHAGVQLQPAQIESAHRVQPMKKLDGRPKAIVVKLQNRLLKDKIISGLRRSKGISTRNLGLSGADRRFFVNEHLTPINKQLLNAVKSHAKSKSYKFIWVRNCNIFLRKNEESPVLTINSEKDLNKIN